MPVRRSDIAVTQTDGGGVAPVSDIQRSGVTTTPINTPIPVITTGANADTQRSGVIGTNVTTATTPPTGSVRISASDYYDPNFGLPTTSAPNYQYPTIEQAQRADIVRQANTPLNIGAEPPYQESTMAPNAEIQALEQQNLDRQNMLLQNAEEAKKLQAQQLAPAPTDTTYTGGVSTTAKTSATTTTPSATQTTAPTGTTTPTGGTGTSGDQLVQQALSTKFEYNPATDADYKIAATNLENDVAQKMIGRGGLWSSVTQSALQNGLVQLQANYRKQAYENYKDNRNFLMQVAQMQYGREDEAFQRNLAVMKFNADREDAAFSKQMQLENQQIARANAQFNRDMAAAQQAQQQAGAKLNMQANTLAANRGKYESLLQSWQSSGRASKEIAAYFGVAEGTNVTNAYALSAIDKKNQAFRVAQDSIQYDAYNYNQDDLYIKGLQEDFYMADPTRVDIGTKDITQLGNPAQGSNYLQALSKAQTMTADKIYQYAADIAFNYQASAEALGDAYTARLIQDLQALAQKKAAQED